MSYEDCSERNFKSSDDAERLRRVKSLSDELLRRLHESLHASQLINETVWAPLIEEELARRGLLERN